MRASAQYRLLVAGNLLKRLFFEHGATPVAVRVFPPAQFANVAAG